MYRSTHVRDELIERAAEFNEDPREFIKRATGGPHPAEVVFALLYPNDEPTPYDLMVVSEAIGLVQNMRPFPTHVGVAPGRDARWSFDRLEAGARAEVIYDEVVEIADSTRVHDAQLHATTSRDGEVIRP